MAFCGTINGKEEWRFFEKRFVSKKHAEAQIFSDEDVSIDSVLETRVEFLKMWAANNC
jgi:hypothetical protein